MVDTRDEFSLVVVGHVDHGKSTIVGRLMADTGTLPEGKLESIQELCRRTSRPFEYAFLLDALKDERAQGITIDVARCFFKTKKRNYTLIDAPGHIEFLKNMVTGAASAEAALLVIDAGEGIMENSRRHGYLLSMLGIRQIAVIVNKMDLVEYSQPVFEEIRSSYTQFLNQIVENSPTFGWKGPIPFIPVSGMQGDNLIDHSHKMPWYNGPTILEQMDLFQAEISDEQLPLRLPVQDIYKFTRGGDHRRIVAGKIETGSVKQGDSLIFYPSRKRGIIRSLEQFNSSSEIDTKTAGWSVGLTLDEQIYLKRGDIAVHADTKGSQTRHIPGAPFVGNLIQANIFWLGKKPLSPGKKYIFKIHTARAEMEIASINRILDASNLAQKNADAINCNEVAECTIRLDQEIAFDLISTIPQTSRFVIIDDFEISGGGIITGAIDEKQHHLEGLIARRSQHWEFASISREARSERFNQKPCLILVTGPENDNLRKRVAKKIESRLFDDGKFVYFIGMANFIYGVDADLKSNLNSRVNSDAIDVEIEYFRRLAEISYLMLDAGLILVISAREVHQDDLVVLKTVCSDHASNIITIWAGDEISTDLIPDIHLRAEDYPASDLVVKKNLQQRGILFKP